jgi:UDP-glucose 4-epimerase
MLNNYIPDSMSKKRILVTGGTGYIGSHTAIDLIQNQFDVVIVDHLKRSEINVLNRIEMVTGTLPEFHQIDLADEKSTLRFFESQKPFDGIIHFAAYKYVDESVHEPILYYRNNLDSLNNVLDAVKTYKIPHFVFSSSCSVYGNIDHLPVSERTPIGKAESPYARTKQMGEQIIEDCAKVLDSSFISLRYFNPVGAHESGKIGESPAVIPNNLVPRITGTAIGKFPTLNVFGHQLPTRDGSCIRDYIHVMDIAEAHTIAMQKLINRSMVDKNTIINLGSGNGVSVLEAIKAFEEVAKVSLPYQLCDPRPGDVISIYSDTSYAKAILGWETKRTIHDMMSSAWQWELNNKI